MCLCACTFTSFQIAQIDMLQQMGLQPDGIVGHSVGELACGYADGSLSHAEAILAAYWRGRCIKEANLPPGGMAAVGEVSDKHTVLAWGPQSLKPDPASQFYICHYRFSYNEKVAIG